jgi:hypothetical protein
MTSDRALITGSRASTEISLIHHTLRQHWVTDRNTGVQGVGTASRIESEPAEAVLLSATSRRGHGCSTRCCTPPVHPRESFRPYARIDYPDSMPDDDFSTRSGAPQDYLDSLVQGAVAMFNMNSGRRPNRT